jgi:pimeloyl-ACP methyl ester carboxylesterase
MAALAYLRYPTTRLAKLSSALLALLLFAVVSLSTVAGFLLYQILHPSRTTTNFDLSVMMGHPTTFSFPLPGGGNREGWLYPGLRGAPTIIVCHGYQSQRADVLTLVTALQEHQFNVFLFDFTGHGSSAGVTTLGYKESAELHAALQALAGREDVDPQHFGLWGVDMGGYAALRVAAEDHRVAALVVDDAYADPRDMVQVQMKNSGLTVIPMVGNLADFGFRIFNYNYRNVPPVSQQLASTAGLPKLFIQSDDHPELSTMTLRLFVRAPEPKETARDRASYSEMSDDDRKAYENRIVSFFLQGIPPTASSNATH